MTGEIPQAWFDAAQVAADAMADHGMGPMPDHIEAAVKAVLPLIVRDMMEPSDVVREVRYDHEFERSSDHPLGGTTRYQLYDEEFRALLKAALRAWALERGVKLDSD